MTNEETGTIINLCKLLAIEAVTSYNIKLKIHAMFCYIFFNSDNMYCLYKVLSDIFFGYGS